MTVAVKKIFHHWTQNRPKIARIGENFPGGNLQSVRCICCSYSFNYIRSIPYSNVAKVI